MKIGIAQIDCEIGDANANVQTISAMTKQAANAGCDLVAFPELADTGFEEQAIRTGVSTWEQGPFVRICELASELNINVMVGLSEHVGNRVHNSLAVIDRTGKAIARYRKTHLFGGPPVHEDQQFAPGESLTLVRIDGFTFGLMICYDIRFPETARTLTLNGADVLTVVAAWPPPRIEHWKILTRARAIENQAYLLASNRVGVDGPITQGGNSCFVDPYGAVLASANGNESTLLIGEIHRERIEEVRSAMRVFDDRRDDLYNNPQISNGL